MTAAGVDLVLDGAEQRRKAVHRVVRQDEAELSSVTSRLLRLRHVGLDQAGDGVLTRRTLQYQPDTDAIRSISDSWALILKPIQIEAEGSYKMHFKLEKCSIPKSKEEDSLRQYFAQVQY